MAPTPELLYISHSRLHRNRANLIQTLHTVSGFSSCGVNTTLYLPPWYSKVTLESRLRELGVEPTLDVHPMELLHKRWPLSIFTWIYLNKLRAAKHIYVRSARISLALAARRIPHHLEIHTLRELETKRIDLAQLIRNQKSGIIGLFIPISQVLARALERAGADPGRIHVSPSGVDLGAYRDVSRCSFSGERKPKIVYLGRISNDRGLSILSLIAERRLGEILLTGTMDDPIPQVDGLSYRPPVPHKKVPSIYANSDFVLLPYQPELLHADGISPLKLFEAMAAGRSIIASDLPSIREILEHEKTALLVPPADAEAWCRSVIRLREEPDLAIRLADNARKEAVQYSWTNRARAILKAMSLTSH